MSSPLARRHLRDGINAIRAFQHNNNTKSKRFKTAPPGEPSGIHKNYTPDEKANGHGCHCGGCGGRSAQ